MDMCTDELRKAACKLEEHGTFVGYGGNVSKDPLMYDSAVLLREAADTIEGLQAALNKATGNWARADAQVREHDGTRWYHLFGTPERAVQALTRNANASCGECTCVLIDQCSGMFSGWNGDGSPICLLKSSAALLKWLGDDA